MFRKKSHIFVVAMSVVTLGMASGCKHTPEGRADKIAAKISSRLDLNEQQKAELDKLKKEALEDFQSFKSERLLIADELEKQLTNSKLEPEVLKKLAKDHRAKKEAVMDEWIDKVSVFYSQLNQEQKDQVLKDLKKFRSHFDD